MKHWVTFSLKAKWLFILGLCWSWSACALAPAPVPEATATPSLVAPTLLAYATPSATPTPSAPVVSTPPTLTPLPSPTPMTYKIITGDTLLVVAARYGVTLEDLLAANPGIDPRLLVVGSEVIIPLMSDQGAADAPAAATPLPVVLGPVECYAAGEGGAWCITTARNRLGTAVESLSAWIGVSPEQGGSAVGAVAYAPLNLLPDGSQMPLLVYLPLPLVSLAGGQVQAELLTAQAAPEGDGRYLPAVAQVERVEIAAQGLQARWQGRIEWQADAPPAWLWVVVVAYDAQNQPLGMRKWESQILCAAQPGATAAETSQTPCTSQPVDMTVFSFGPPIHHVDTLVEARP